jgi:hypothetical protein
VPTLSGSDGEPLAADVEQLRGSTAFIIRLAHRLGSTVRKPDQVAGVLPENLLSLYRQAAGASVVQQTLAAGLNAVPMDGSNHDVLVQQW